MQPSLSGAPLEDALPSVGHDARSFRERLRRVTFRSFKLARQSIFPRSVSLHVMVGRTQRSGTNPLMDVLDASLATRVFHETDGRAFRNYEMRDRSAIHQLARRCPAPVFVIKALCELDQIASLMRFLRPAKTLWVVRGWRDTARSAVRSFGDFVPQWKQLAYGASHGDWRGRGMSRATRDLLRSLFRSDASEPDGAAIMWYYRNILFFEQALEDDPRVRVTSYERLVRDPVTEVAEICEFLGVQRLRGSVIRRIHSTSVGRGTELNVAPEIAQICDRLHERFLGLQV